MYAGAPGMADALFRVDSNGGGGDISLAWAISLVMGGLPGKSSQLTESSASCSSRTWAEDASSGDGPAPAQWASTDTHAQSGLSTTDANVMTGRPKSCACTTRGSSGTAAGSWGNTNQNNAVALGIRCYQLGCSVRIPHARNVPNSTENDDHSLSDLQCVDLLYDEHGWPVFHFPGGCRFCVARFVSTLILRFVVVLSINFLHLRC